jgi:glycosyltransferase involved in cell wall biosynthesis
MNVLILTALYPPAVGGAATYYSDLVETLQTRGEIERVIVLTERQANLPGRLDAGKASVLRRLPQRVSRDKTHRLIHAATYILTDAFLLSRLSGIVQQHRVDLIHFHSRYRSPLTHLALRRTRLPVVADLRDRMVAPHRLAFCDAILCCAEGLRRFALEDRVPEQKLVYVPNPLPNFEKPTPAEVQSVLAEHHLSPRQPYFLYVGDMTPNKGVYELLAGFQTFARETQATLQLFLVGVNREGQRFIQRAQEVPDTRYLGPLTRMQVLALMRQANAVLLPSRSEGLPTVILEALSLGQRVMCPPGVIEFERECPEWVLPQVSAQAITEFLCKLQERSDKPAFPLEAYSWPHVVDQLMAVYASLLKRPSHEQLRS